MRNFKNFKLDCSPQTNKELNRLLSKFPMNCKFKYLKASSNCSATIIVASKALLYQNKYMLLFSALVKFCGFQQVTVIAS